MEENRQNWWKPPIKDAGSPCLCCNSKGDMLSLDTKMYTGFGGWTVYKNGDIFYYQQPHEEFDDAKTIDDMEAIIGDDEINEYTASFLGPLSDAIYQRHSKNHWVLIEQGLGFA